MTPRMNPPNYEDDPDELLEDETEQDDGYYVDLDDPADWPICDPLWSPQPRD